MYEMKDEYLTGIEQIDKEHRRFFEIAEEAYQLQQAEFIADKYDNIRKILEELKDYALMHLDHEEEYMESINYKRMFIQKVQHDAFRRQLDEINLDEIDENQDGAISDILTFVTDWLANHILDNDILIGV